VSTPEVGPDQVVIGVAIAVPEPYGAELMDARARFGDPAATQIPSHITLVGPTVVSWAELDQVDAHLAQVAARHQPFELSLGGSASFRPISPVVYVQVTVGAPQCTALADDVRSGPLAQDLRFAYHPHVTVAQQLSDDQLDLALTEMADFAADFDITTFQRYEHGADGVWRAVRTLVLGA